MLVSPIMREVAVATLKARLSDYLQYVRQGEQVLITENGRKVTLLARWSPAHPRGGAPACLSTWLLDQAWPGTLAGS
jgi:antitoxin (DNA-binding transcriptional repressor) of toxin-antitoxin stability system